MKATSGVTPLDKGGMVEMHFRRDARARFTKGVKHGVHVDNLTPAVARDLGLKAGTKGVVVTDVADGTPASDAGLQRDDVIEEINHLPVSNVADYERVVREAGKQELVLLVNRSGQTSFVVVEPE
jgi:serine protease Do